MTKQNIVEGIGRKEAKLIASLLENGQSIFRSEDANRILGNNLSAVNSLLSRLVKKKKVLRLERGKYLIIPPEAWRTGDYLEDGIILAASLVEPYYLSYWTALNYYGYTEQPSNTIFIAAQRSRVSLNIGQIKFQFIKLNQSKFFGFETVWIHNQKVNMATREKMIIDCLDQPRYCGEIVEVAKGLWNGRNELNWKTLAEDAIKMKNSAILKRLGFLMEVLGIPKPAVIKKIREKIGKGYSPLDANGNKSGKYNNRWRLLINIPVKTLTEWRRY